LNDSRPVLQTLHVNVLSDFIKVITLRSLNVHNLAVHVIEYLFAVV